MSGRTKITRSNTTTTIDSNGEVSSQTRSFTIQYPQEPPFIKLYLHDVCYFQDMPRSYSNVLYELFKRMSYAGDPTGDEDWEKDTGSCGMIVYLNSEMKRSIMKNIGITSMQSLNNILTNLTKGKLLLNIGRGTFRLNPHLFGRGDWKNIVKLQMTLTYDDMGRTYQTTILECKTRKAIVKNPDDPNDYIEWGGEEDND